MLSIIIPVYNAEKCLQRCLDSILNQTNKDWECIIIDDGSKDSSSVICDDYAAKDIRFIVRHKDNAGVSSARNDGIELAQGEYLTFVDSDDWIESNYVQVLSEVAGKADLIYFSDRKFGEDKYVTTYQLPNFFSTSKDDIEAVIKHLSGDSMTSMDFYGFTWNKLFKKDIISNYNVRFIPEQFWREDQLFTNDYVQHCSSLMTIDDVIYNYRWTKGGLTYLNKDKIQYFNLRENILNYIKTLHTAALKKAMVEKVFFFTKKEYESLYEYNTCNFIKDMFHISKEAGTKVPKKMIFKTIVKNILRA